jgi:hypothetical protein
MMDFVSADDCQPYRICQLLVGWSAVIQSRLLPPIQFSIVLVLERPSRLRKCHLHAILLE